MKLHNYRKQYNKSSLDEGEIPVDPLELFQKWFQLATEAHQYEANAMILSTVAHLQPSARVVLLKEVSLGGFVFFTNYESRKGKEMASNPNACLTFYWAELERQVRIEGKVERVSAAESTAYFDSRPLESRISAAVSPQSEVIPSRALLEAKIEDYKRQNKKIERPDHWGGLRLMPDVIEFWQGRPNRLHDRIRYVHHSGGWMIERLAP